jgi:hypothetical protein
MDGAALPSKRVVPSGAHVLAHGVQYIAKAL